MKKLASLALAGGLVLTGVGFVAAPAAEASCCYKLPAGTWGSQTHFYDVHAYYEYYSGREVRYREDYRMYWDGTKWYNAVYFRGYYYSGNWRA